MKKLRDIVLGIACLGLIFSGFPAGRAKASDNLIANPSVETANPTGNAPEAWNTGYLWGDLDASYSYEQTGQDGNRSLKIDVTRYQSGDAKWYFEPVAVEADTTYQFIDYYKASVSTDLLAQFELQDSSIQYKWLTSLPSVDQWSEAKVEFKTPASAVRTTVFHTIASVGYLQTDTFSLAKPEVTNNIVPNPSFENHVNNSRAAPPISWYGSHWGGNNAKFNYLWAGHTGSHSVRVTVSNYSSGDAKWSYEPVAIVGGATYHFSDYYQSTISSRVVIWAVMADGSDQYISLKDAPASSQWQQYSDTFSMPTNAVRATVFHLIEANGSLTVDDYSLQQIQPQGFSRGIVTLTFDDGWEGIYTYALPLLQQYNIAATHFYVSGFIDTQDYQTLQQVMALRDAGQEIGSHTVTHSDLTALSATELDHELRDSKDFLENALGIPVTNFASPYGAYNSTVVSAIQGYYASHRTVDAGYNDKSNFDQYHLKVQNVLATTTPAEVNAWVQTALQQKTWLILVYHNVDPTTVGEYDTTTASLQAHLQSINQSGIHTATISQALAELIPQL